MEDELMQNGNSAACDLHKAEQNMTPSCMPNPNAKVCKGMQMETNVHVLFIGMLGQNFQQFVESEKKTQDHPLWSWWSCNILFLVDA